MLYIQMPHDCDLSLCCQLWVVMSLKLFSFIQGGVRWQHPAQRLQCHVSGLPRGREDIREHDIVCLSFWELQLHCCDFLGRVVHSHISQLQRDCCNETRQCSVGAKSSHNRLLPLRGEHLQPGCRFQNRSGHPPEYVITEDIRLHSP